LDKLDFDKSWAYETLKNIIKPKYKVCMLPLAFREDMISSKAEWEKAYNKLNGEHYGYSVMPLLNYGINDNNITLINCFVDSPESAKAKINASDILFLPGGFPDKIMDRLTELDLVNVVEQHGGIIMGWSAGAMVQCLDYYLSPDEDYPEFAYKKGLNCIKDFAVEVHYRNAPSQNKSIEKFIREKGKAVYTTENQSAIIVDGSKVTLLGNAKVYQL
jgi:peptidase E